jgi:hypothetical protein
MNKPQLIVEEIIELFAGTTADDDGEIASMLKNYLMHLSLISNRQVTSAFMIEEAALVWVLR